MMKREMVKALINYKGRVQGVGFRFYVEEIALECKVTGWVKNLSNGNVEVEVEGEKKSILTMMDGVAGGRLGSNVTKINLRWLPYEGSHTDFTIEYDF